MIYSTNWIERLNKEFKRVLDIRNSMPNPDSALALAGAVADTLLWTLPVNICNTIV